MTHLLNFGAMMLGLAAYLFVTWRFWSKRTNHIEDAIANVVFTVIGSAIAIQIVCSVWEATK